jgi:hypothetical protein
VRAVGIPSGGPHELPLAGGALVPDGRSREKPLWMTAKHHLANARSRVGAATTARHVWILAPRLPEPENGAQSDV